MYNFVKANDSLFIAIGLNQASGVTDAQNSPKMS